MSMDEEPVTNSRAINFSGFKKVADDKTTATMRHPSGHEIKIHKALLTPLHRKILEKLPLHRADGGDTNVDTSTKEPAIGDSSQLEVQPVSEPAIGGAATIPVDTENAAPVPEEPASVPAAEQISAKTAPTETIAAEKPISTSDLPNVSAGSIYKSGLSAIDQEQKVASQLAAEKLKATQSYDQNLAARDAKWESDSQSKLDEIKKVATDLPHLNPNRYQESLSSGQKVANAIGLLLGGFSGGYNGTANPAATWINEQIGRDIAAQKQDIENKQTLLGALQHQYGNSVVAENIARASLAQHYSNQIQTAAEKIGTPAAAVAAAQAKTQLQQQILPLVQHAQGIEILNTPASTNGDNPVDLRKFNALQKLGIMPQADAEATQKEGQTYVNHVNEAKAIMTEFYKAKKDNTLSNRAGHAGFEPASVSALQVALTPYFRDADGKVNTVSLEAAANAYTPKPLDGPAKEKERELGLQSFLTEKNSPESFINLSRYNLINKAKIPNLTPGGQHKPGDIVYINGKKGQVQANGHDVRAVQ